MRTSFLAILPLFSLLGCLPSNAAVPSIIHVSDPIRPDQTALITGDSFGENATVELAPIPPDAKNAATVAATAVGTHWQALVPLQQGKESMKFVVPKDWTQGIWLCRVRNGSEVSTPVVLNAPTVWWWNGDAGERVSPGGWLRVFGKALSFGTPCRAKLTREEGAPVALATEESNPYGCRLAVPKDLAEGEYKLWLHNGLGGEAAWTPAGDVKVQAAPVWDSTTFNVKDFGPKPAEALLAALEKARANGGGVVFLPRGRYAVKDTLQIPPGTVLRGESAELVSLYWPDFETPPIELITGSNYALEDLSVYCQNHKQVITDTPKSEHVALIPKD